MTDTALAPQMTSNDMARNLLLLRAVEALSTTATAAEVVEAVSRLRGVAFEASRVHVHLRTDRADPMTRRAADERRALFFSDGTELAAAALGPMTPQAQAAAWVPLIGESSVLGVMQVLWDAPRTFYVAERAVITTLAAYIAHALERARRLDVRAGIAQILQEAILSRTPTVNQYEVAARYLPADQEETVGGDWYDAIPKPGGRLTMVIGDVVGHDIAAAARMGQLRSMLRAYIVDRPGAPSDLLRRLDSANHVLGEPILATAVVAVIDRSVRDGYRLRWSNAGHPPPVMILRDGTVRALSGHDRLLGVDRRAARRCSSIPLETGSTVLLHTDGLAGRPGRRTGEDFTDLYRRLRTARRTRLDDLLEDAIAPFGADPVDDIAVLAVRLPATR